MWIIACLLLAMHVISLVYIYPVFSRNAAVFLRNYYVDMPGFLTMLVYLVLWHVILLFLN